MIRNMTPEEVQSNIEENLVSVNDAHDLVIIERQGQALGAIVNSEELRDILDRRRTAEAWLRLDAVADQNADLDPDFVMAMVQEEVDAVRLAQREHEE